MEQKIENKISFTKSPIFKSIISTILCILAGLLVGFVIMLVIALTSPGMSIQNAFRGLMILISGPFASGSYALTNFGDMLFYATPLIMTGLSVAIAFKTGLFNIGAPGQFLVGTAASLIVALSFPANNQITGILVWISALVAAFVFGMLWGAIPGAFKSLFNANEVIVCIMTNWIAANLVSWIFTDSRYINTGHGKSGYLLTTAATNNGTPNLGLSNIFKGSYLDMGLFVAIVFAIIVYIILEKTILGYELKAGGFNRHAGKYAGMNEKRNIILSMAIAGGLAALGGALYYLNPGIEFKYSSAYSKLPDYGFNGIPVALLASSNPIGVIFSGIFLRYINQGGDNLVSAGFNRYISDIIIAIIIYFAGFAKLLQDLSWKKRFIKRKNKNNIKNIREGRE